MSYNDDSNNYLFDDEIIKTNSIKTFKDEMKGCDDIVGVMELRYHPLVHFSMFSNKHMNLTADDAIAMAEHILSIAHGIKAKQYNQDKGKL